MACALTGIVAGGSYVRIIEGQGIGACWVSKGVESNKADEAE